MQPALHYRKIITIKIPSDSANSRLCNFIPSNFSFEWVCLFFLEWDLVKILSMSLRTKNQRLSSVCAQSRAMTANIPGQTSCKIQLASDTCPNRCMTFVQVWLDCVMSCSAPALSTRLSLSNVFNRVKWEIDGIESRVPVSKPFKNGMEKFTGYSLGILVLPGRRRSNLFLHWRPVLSPPRAAKT